eukprot:757063-Hanusia_phi.AAC.1
MIVGPQIVHCGSGPLFLLTWPLFSSTHTAPLLASLGSSLTSSPRRRMTLVPAVPTINALRLVSAGGGVRRTLSALGLVERGSDESGEEREASGK